MKNNLRFLGIIITVFGSFFYLVPFFNHLKSAFVNLNYFDTELIIRLFNTLIYLICGIGIFKFKKIARIIWIAYAACTIIISLPFTIAMIQQLTKGSFKITDFPVFYWVKNYGSLLLLMFSLVFLNLSKVKKLFIRKKL